MLAQVRHGKDIRTEMAGLNMILSTYDFWHFKQKNNGQK
jgi:hypothetical protein